MNRKDEILVAVMCQVMEEASRAILAEFPNSTQIEVIDFVKNVFAELNVTGNVVTAEALCAAYRQFHNGPMN